MQLPQLSPVPGGTNGYAQAYPNIGAMASERQALYDDYRQRILQARAAQEAALLAKQQQNAQANVRVPAPDILGLQAQARGYQTAIDPTSGFATVAAPAGAGSPDQGFWAHLTKRGIPQAAASFENAVAALADVAGNKIWASELAYDAQKRSEEAAKAAPRRIASIEDISSVGDFGTYAKETFADLIPSMGATMAGAIGGGLAGGPAGAISTGMLTSGAMEAGSAYGTDIQRHGIGGTSPGMDIATGAIAGGLEALSKPFHMVVSAFKPAVQQAVAQGTNSLLKKYGTEIFETSGSEALTELAQEYAQIINENIQDEKDMFTVDDSMRLIDAAAAGALGGMPFGAYSGYTKPKYVAPKTPEELRLEQQRYWEAAEPTIGTAPQVEASRATPFDTSLDDFYGANKDLRTAASIMESTRDSMQESLGLNALDTQLENAATTLAELEDVTHPNTQGIPENARKARVTKQKAIIKALESRRALAEKQAALKIREAQMLAMKEAGLPEATIKGALGGITPVVQEPTQAKSLPRKGKAAPFTKKELSLTAPDTFLQGTPTIKPYVQPYDAGAIEDAQIQMLLELDEDTKNRARMARIAQEQEALGNESYPPVKALRKPFTAQEIASTSPEGNLMAQAMPGAMPTMRPGLSEEEVSRRYEQARQVAQEERKRALRQATDAPFQEEQFPRGSRGKNKPFTSAELQTQQDQLLAQAHPLALEALARQGLSEEEVLQRYQEGLDQARFDKLLNAPDFPAVDFDTMPDEFLGRGYPRQGVVNTTSTPGPIRGTEASMQPGAISPFEGIDASMRAERAAQRTPARPSLEGYDVINYNDRMPPSRSGDVIQGGMPAPFSSTLDSFLDTPEEQYARGAETVTSLYKAQIQSLNDARKTAYFSIEPLQQADPITYSARKAAIDKDYTSKKEALDKAYNKQLDKLRNNFDNSIIEASTKTTPIRDTLIKNIVKVKKYIANTQKLLDTLVSNRWRTLDSINRKLAKYNSNNNNIDNDIVTNLGKALNQANTLYKQAIQERADFLRTSKRVLISAGSTKQALETAKTLDEDLTKLYAFEGQTAEQMLSNVDSLANPSVRQLMPKAKAAPQATQVQQSPMAPQEPPVATTTTTTTTTPAIAPMQPSVASAVDTPLASAKNTVLGILKQLPRLSSLVDIVDEVPPTLGTIAQYMPDGRIRIYAQALISRSSEGGSKPVNKALLKELASKAIVHEGIVHHGLRAIMSASEFSSFMKLVDKSFRGTKTWNALTKNVEGFDSLSPEVQAEEFVAKLAERQKINKLTEEGKTLWSKAKTFLRKILARLGFGKIITEQDIIDTVSLSSYYLSGIPRESLTQTPAPNPSVPLQSAEADYRTRAEQVQETLDKGLLGRAKDLWNDRQDTIEKLREVATDAYRPLEVFQRKLKALPPKEDGSLRIDYGYNLFKNLQQMPNQVGVDLKNLHLEFVDPILTAISQIGGKDMSPQMRMAQAEDYVEAVASLERNRLYGEENTTGMSNTKANEILAKYADRRSEFEPLLKLFQDLNRARLSMLEQYKILPKEKIDAWRKAYQYYMPFRNWEEALDHVDPTWFSSDTRRSLSTPNIQKRLGQRVKGRNTQAKSSIVNSFVQLYDTAVLARKVEMQRQLLQLAEVNNDPRGREFLEVVEVRTPENKSAWPGWKRTVNEKTGEIEYVQTRSSAEGHSDEVISCISEDGSIVKVWVKDPHTAKALKGNNVVHAQGLIKYMGQLQRVMGQFMTSRNPLFWLRNPIRDTFTAYLNMGKVYDELRQMGVPSPREIAAAIVNKGLFRAIVGGKASVRAALLYYYRNGADKFKTKYLDNPSFSPELKAYLQDIENFMAYGGQAEFYGNTAFERIQKDTLKAISDKNPATKSAKGRAIASNLVDYMDDISSSLENMTRYVAFKEIVDALRTHGTRPDGVTPLSSEEIYRRAANIALNLTVNFTRKGSWSPVFNSLYLFSSAAIGGNVRMLETILRKGPDGKYNWKTLSQFAAMPMMAYTLQAMLCRALMPDDDDGVNLYDKIPGYEKDSNIIVPNPLGEGGYFKIPLPYGYNMFWSLARNISDSIYATASGTPGPSFAKAGSNIMASVFDGFSVTGRSSEGFGMLIPSVLKPLIQLYANENFAGNPIMPDSTHLVRGQIPDSQKYWSTTSTSIKALAEAMNELTGGSVTRSGAIDVSPETLDHLGNAYFGGVYKLGMSMLDTAETLMNGKPVDMNKLPGANVFYKTPGDQASVRTPFTKIRMEVATQVAAVDEMRKDPRLSPSERFQIMQDNKQGWALKGLMDSTNSALNKIRAQEKRIDKMANLSVEAKQKRLDLLEAQKKRLWAKFTKAALQKGIPLEDF